MKRWLAGCVVAAVLAACGAGGFQRGVFYGKVIDRTPEEVTSSFGKPDAMDTSIPDSPRFVYVKKTFNPDNENRVDEKTIIDFAKNRDGKTICVDVSYM
jgi:hypothetical protein